MKARTKSSHSIISQRAAAYMAEMMDMHEPGTDQEQNQLCRHLCQFAMREIRRERGEPEGRAHEVATRRTKLGPEPKGPF